MPPTILCIDGNIGAGKSSLMQRLAPHYRCFPEPVSEWTLLSPFYQHPQRYAFPFQLQVLLSQFQQSTHFPENGIVLVERCPWTSRHVFAPLLLGASDLQLYDRLHHRLAFHVDAFIYLDIDPETAFQRIHQRSAVDRHISLDYLQRLHQQYAVALTHLPSVWTLDAHQPPETLERSVLKLIASISPNGPQRSFRPRLPPI